MAMLCRIIRLSTASKDRLKKRRVEASIPESLAEYHLLRPEDAGQADNLELPVGCAKAYQLTKTLQAYPGAFAYSLLSCF